MEVSEMVRLAVKALDDKKGNDIRVIDIREISTMCDYFILVDGACHNQLRALCDSVEESFLGEGIKLKNKEGTPNGGWLLLDYYDIIIHIFAADARSFYDLEHIWRDGILVSTGEL